MWRVGLQPGEWEQVHPGTRLVQGGQPVRVLRRCGVQAPERGSSRGVADEVGGVKLAVDRRRRPASAAGVAGLLRLAKRWALEEGGGELVVVSGPPAAAAVVLFDAARPAHRRDSVRVTRIDAAPRGCFDAGEGIAHGREQR